MARNIPYDAPKSLWDALSRPRDAYKANYDRVFEANPEGDAILRNVVEYYQLVGEESNHSEVS